MKRWKVFHRLRSFFKTGRGCHNQMIFMMFNHKKNPKKDEHDRSTKKDDLNLKDWTLEDSFKLVSDFLDSMPSNSQDTMPEMSIKTASRVDCSVSLSKGFSLHKTSIQTSQKQDQQLEALGQQMNEISILLAQSGIRREKLPARVCAALTSCWVYAFFLLLKGGGGYLKAY